MRSRHGIRVALLALLLALCGSAQASAARARFAVSVSGTQSTVARSSANCIDASGTRVEHSGQLNERIDFSTQRPGRVVFSSVGRTGTKVAQPAVILAGGTVDRQSSLDERGVTPGECADVAPASGCGSQPFSAWRLSLTGPLAIGIRAGVVPGGNPFRACQNPFNGFPGLVLAQPGKLGRKAIFNRKKRRLTVRAKLGKTRSFADGYTGAAGSVQNGLSFTVVLIRR